MLVVEGEVLLYSALGLADAVISRQIHFFVIDALPEPFHEHLIAFFKKRYTYKLNTCYKNGGRFLKKLVATSATRLAPFSVK
jgi:hypothetical protein